VSARLILPPSTSAYRSTCCARLTELERAPENGEMTTFIKPVAYALGAAGER
jgi:hypothetical protein